MDLLKNNLVAGIGLAFAATVLAPIVLPLASRAGRPIAKSLVRGGMMMYERGREVVAVAGESVEDLMAEIRAEHHARTGAASAAGAGAMDGADAGAGATGGPDGGAGTAGGMDAGTGGGADRGGAAQAGRWPGNGADSQRPPAAQGAAIQAADR